jgi:hypothetical protein
MPQTEPTAELNAGFSEPGAAAPPWAEVAEALSNSARHASPSYLARRNASLLHRFP